MKINKLFFWITSSTTVLSLFLFIFGLSSFAYYMTGVETSDMGTILRVLQQFIKVKHIFFNINDITFFLKKVLHQVKHYVIIVV